MTAETQPGLARLRRRAHAKIVTVMARLVGRRTPWRDWQPIPAQLRLVGFGDIDDAGQRELEALNWFLTEWLDLLDMTDGLFWDDDE